MYFIYNKVQAVSGRKRAWWAKLLLYANWSWNLLRICMFANHGWCLGSPGGWRRRVKGRRNNNDSRNNNSSSSLPFVKENGEAPRTWKGTWSVSTTGANGMSVMYFIGGLEIKHNQSKYFVTPSHLYAKYVCSSFSDTLSLSVKKRAIWCHFSFHWRWWQWSPKLSGLYVLCFVCVGFLSITCSASYDPFCCGVKKIKLFNYSIIDGNYHDRVITQSQYHAHLTHSNRWAE